MSASLENKTSLRKLEFPQSTQEALSRLFNTFSARSGSSMTLTMPPKETELILETIDEFVFLNKPTKSRKTAATQTQISNVQELQLMQVLIDFFILRSPIDADFVPLSNVFNYLFMDPPSDLLGQSRSESLAKFSILALGLKCQPVLNFLGLWIQNATLDKSRALVTSLVNDYILLIPDSPEESLKNIPMLSPLFASHFMNVAAEIYSPIDGNKPPPKVLVELFVLWLESSNPDKLLPLKGFMTQFGSISMTWTNPYLCPLVGLAKLAVLGPTLKSKFGDDQYAKLHLFVLESLAEAADHRHLLLKNDLVPANKLVSLVEAVASRLPKSNSGPETEACLDRLGQFLNCILTSKLVQGKWTETCSAVSKLPEFKRSGNRLLKVFLQRAKGQ